MTYKTLQTSRLYEQIVEQIENSVLAGILKPGDQLPAERELANQFGVSRTAVREAVKTLREKGLVEAYPGRGTFITNGTSQAIRQSFGLMLKMGGAESTLQLVEVREILEPEIAALAATRAQDRHIAGMSEAVATMEAAMTDPDRFVEADLDFHLLLAEATENPFVPILIDSIVGLLREQRRRNAHVAEGLARGQSHHRRILAAIERHDPVAAREAMRAHLRQVRDDARASTAIPDEPLPSDVEPDGANSRPAEKERS